MASGASTAVRPQQIGDPGYLPTLDGWRAIAVTLVIASHCDLLLAANGGAAGRLAARFVLHAGYGVDIFFALSGYLITTLLLREKAREGRISLSGFYLRRAFRILPALFCYLLVVSLVAGARPAMRVGGDELLASLLFVRNYAAGSWYTGHLWSLSIEEQFYLVIPCLVLLLRPRTLMAVTVALAAACVVIRANELAHPQSFGPLPQFRTENRVDALLVGALLAQLAGMPAILEWLRSRSRPWMALLLAVAVAGLLAGFDSQAARRTVAAFGLPPLILLTVLHPRTLVGRLLEAAPVRLVGRMSYSLYLWQMPFLVHGPHALGPFQSLPLALLMPVPLAAASHWLIERPFIRMGHRLARGMAGHADGRGGFGGMLVPRPADAG